MNNSKIKLSLLLLFTTATLMSTDPERTWGQYARSWVPSTQTLGFLSISTAIAAKLQQSSQIFTRNSDASTEKTTNIISYIALGSTALCGLITYIELQKLKADNRENSKNLLLWKAAKETQDKNLENLENEVEQTKKTISVLDNNDSRYNQKIEELNKKLNDLQAQKDRLEKALTLATIDLKKEEASLEQQINDMGTNISTELINKKTQTKGHLQNVQNYNQLSLDTVDFLTKTSDQKNKNIYNSPISKNFLNLQTFFSKKNK